MIEERQIDVDAEVARFQGELPIAQAHTPPSSWYTEPAIFERERDAVLEATWQYACPLSRVQEPGQFARVDFLGQSYLIVRDSEGILRGHHNVCRHHAALLLEGQGCVERLVCPYHGWTYELNGRLAKAPRMGAMQDFDRERFGLEPVAVEAWGPFVFFHAGQPARALREELAQLEPRLEALGTSQLKHVSQRRYPMECNWKVFVDNYLDGGYHIAHLHHGLASQLSLEKYRTEVFERFSIQSCPSDEQASFHGRDFRERIGGGALYAWVYPNFMLNRYGPILDINWVLPIDHQRCEVVFDYWFTDTEGEAAEKFIAQSLAASDNVQQEDVWISESVQRGVSSRAYDYGRYAPELEVGMFQFHRLLAEDLR